MTATKKTPKTLGPCLCSLFDFDVWIDDEAGTHSDGYDTGCTEQTKRDFAQGHDAKLAGFLTRADVANHEIRRVEGGIALTYSNAVDAAMQISEAFAAKVQKQIGAKQVRIQRARAALAAKRDKAPSAERKLAETAGLAKVIQLPVVKAEDRTTKLAQIKVGRWTYEAEISLVDGGARYTNKGGVPMVAGRDRYTEVN